MNESTSHQRNFARVALVALLLLAHCGDPAQPDRTGSGQTFDYRNLPRQIAAYELPTGSEHFDVAGDTAVVAQKWNSFAVVDMSDAAAPKEWVKVAWPERVVDVCQKPPHLFVLDRQALHVLDRHAVDSPPLGSFLLPENSTPLRMILQETCVIALQAGPDHLLLFVDVRDPAQPRMISQVAVGGRIVDITVEADLLLVGTENGAVFLNIADTSNVKTISSIGLGYYVALANGFAYVSGTTYGQSRYTSGGITALNVQDPANPQEIGSTLVPSGRGPMVLQGTRLFVRVEGQVDVINVVDRRQLQAEGSIPAEGRGWLQFEGGNLWVSGKALLGYEIGEAVSAPVLGEQGLWASWSWAQLAGSRLFSVGRDGLFALNVQDPQLTDLPRDYPGSFRGRFQVDGQELYQYGGDYGFSGNQLFVRNLSTDQLLSTVTFDHDITDVLVDREYFYAILHREIYDKYFLQVFDITDALAPRLLGSLTRGGDPYVNPADMHLVGDWLFVLSLESLDVIDVARPSRPRVVAQLPIKSSGKMTIHDDYAYVTLASYESPAVLHVIDIRDPRQPRIVSQAMALPGRTVALVAEGNFLYWGKQRSLTVFDITHRSNPQLVGTQGWVSINPAENLLVGNGVVYAMMDFGIQILPLHAPGRAP